MPRKRQKASASFFGGGSVVYISDISGAIPKKRLKSGAGSVICGGDISGAIAKEVIQTVGEGTNVIFSPLAMNVLLALIAAGSRGGTLEQLLSYFKTDSAEFLNSQFSGLITELMPDDDDDTNTDCFRFSTGVWLHNQLSFSASFKHLAEADYKAILDLVDFDKIPEVIEHVNSRVEKDTGGLVKGILPPGSIQEGEKLILTNTTYFKGSWIHKFDKSLTKDGDFHLLDGGIARVPFMKCHGKTLKNDFNLKKDSYGLKLYDGFKVLKLPYNQYSFAMYFFLPDETDGLPSLVQKMGTEPDFLERHMMIIDPESNLGTIKIPKFKFMTDFDASEMLKKEGGLGLNRMFEATGGITEMVEEIPQMVSRVFHSGLIEVDEEGVKAVATVRMNLAPRSSRFPPKLIDFIADHPFLFVIREDDTKAILFIGQVNNPMPRL